MAKRNEIFPSKYLKASDLAGKPLVVEIERAPQRRSAAATTGRKNRPVFQRRRSRCRST